MLDPLWNSIPCSGLFGVHACAAGHVVVHYSGPVVAQEFLADNNSDRLRALSRWSFVSPAALHGLHRLSELS